ncbi:MAG: molybdate ABC transporter substrate-binding protein [Methylococcaceae bacterium]
MKRFNVLVFTVLLLFSLSAHAENIAIAAASDLKFVMDEIVSAFKKDHPNDEIAVTYGSSGKFFTQIQQNAPYDLFFSADIDLPRELVKSGLASSEVKPYAFGRLVLWSASLDASKMTLNSLTDAQISHVAIANPKHAPYGKRAEEALRASGLWDKVESKLVYGENITQTTQFVQTGNAQVGILALSLMTSPEIASKGGYWLIPDNLHQPLEQGYIITKRAENNELAKSFADYMETESTRTLMTKYGFVLPNQATDK